jgi:hypothetical protein
LKKDVQEHLFAHTIEEQVRMLAQKNFIFCNCISGRVIALDENFTVDSLPNGVGVPMAWWRANYSRKIILFTSHDPTLACAHGIFLFFFGN